MILEQSQLKDIILYNPNKALVRAGVEYCKTLRRHMYGIDQEFHYIEGFENPLQKNARAKYSKSNKDLFSRLGRPIDKVFSARGGSVYYNLSAEQEKRAANLARNVKSGYSAKQWNESFWKPHFLDDPNGLLFMEIAPAQEALRLKKEGRSFVYPTYKPITCIYDYLPDGVNLEYVVFHMDQSDKKALNIESDRVVYRVVDDAFDYIVERKGDEVIILEQLTLPNYFMFVPGMLNGDIPNPNHEGNMLSLYDDIIELAEHFLLTGSVKFTHELLHGFPKYWEYADSCVECDGSGYSGSEKCTTCKGTGKSLMTKVSDAKMLTYPTEKETPVLTPNVAGYVEPSKIYYEIATNNLQLLEAVMCFTLWGTVPQQKTQGMSIEQAGAAPTATEIVSELKPQADRLHPISESAEKRNKFMLDCIIKVQINQNYPGSSVNYGKRYMIEGPDEVWLKYSDARTKGASISVLDDLLNEYYEAKYSSDPVKLAIQQKLTKVEPFVHYTVIQVKALMPGEEDYKAKLYFGEWLATLNEAMILSFSAEELRTQLYENTSKYTLPEPEVKKPAIA